jgi:DMSO/TMAO reductase YedYZ molybdopterin-dependent catalytic subunit
MRSVLSLLFKEAVIKRRVHLLLASLLAAAAALAFSRQALAQTDPMPSWNDGPTKRRPLISHNQPLITEALYDEAKKKGWIVISMENDWKRIFAFEQ